MANIYPHIKKGKLVSFKLRAFLGRDKNGKQIFKCRTWKVPEGITEKKARKEAQIQADSFEKEWLKRFEAENKTLKSQKITLQEFIDTIWLPSLTGNYRPTTIEFKKDISKVIKHSFLGKKKIQNINNTDIEIYFKKQKIKYSPKTLRHHHSTLNLIFKDAIKNNMITTNPIKDIETLPIKRRKVDAFSKTESVDFIEMVNTKPLRLKLMYHLLLTTGLRRGELYGLRWSDIIFEEKILIVNLNVTYAGGKINIGDAKTPAGECRVIPITNSVIELLKGFQKEEQDKYPILKNTDFLFHSENQTNIPQNPQYLTKRMRKDLAKLNLPKMSPHDLRHTCASLLIQYGADIKSVQDILGHADAGTTLNYYVRGDINKMREAVDNAFK